MPTSRSPLARVLPAALLCLSAVLLPGPVAAHAVLVEARPRDGERLDRPPPEVALRFDEPIAPVAVRLLDASGAEVPGVTVEARGVTLVVRPSVPLEAGAYLLSYRVTSLDGHPVGATLRFGIGTEAVPRGGEATSVSEGAAAWGGVVTRWLAYVTALGAAGLALFAQAVRPPEPVAARTRRLLAWLAAAGIAAALLRLGVTGLDLVTLPPAALATAEPWAAAAGTTLGRATVVAVVGLAFLAAGSRRGGWPLAAGALLVASSFALTGHAASAEPRWLTAPSVAAHALCGAFWLGSLLPLLWSLRLAPAEAGAVLRRFSAAATVAVASLVAVGACLAWIQLEGRAAGLWESAYGLRLAGKLALVACLLGLAAANRLVLTPRVARGDPAGRRHLRRTLAADVALGLGVLAFTASLPLGPPPRVHTPGGPDTAAAGVTVVVAGRGGAQATLTLVPGRPGANRLEAWVTDGSGTPVGAKEATVSAALPEAGIEPTRLAAAAASRPGVYLADGVPLPTAGRWRLRLDLLVDDFTKLTFEAEVRLP